MSTVTGARLMFNILIIIVMVVVVALSAAFAGITFLQGVRSTVELQITKQRLLEVATQVQANARYVNGVYALPAGTTGSSPYAYNQVPSWITTNAKGANGVPFAYCPYSSISGSGTANIVSPSGSNNYYATLTTSDATSQRPYVTASAAAPTALGNVGATGALVAAAPQSYSPPDCSSISAASVDSVSPIVSGGIVVPIGDNYLNKAQVATSPGEVRFYVSTAASGDASGRDASNYTTLSDALERINVLKPASATVFINVNGTYTTTETLSYGTRLYLNGVSQSATILNANNLVVDEFSMLGLKNIKLVSTGVVPVRGILEFDTGGQLTTPTLYINGGFLGGYQNGNIINGNVTVDGGGKIGVWASLTVNSVSNRGFKIMNGDVNQTAGLTINPSITGITPVYMTPGAFWHQAATLNINGTASVDVAGGIILDPGASYSAISSGIGVAKATQYGIYNHGSMALIDTNLTFGATVGTGGLQYGIVLASGSRFNRNYAGTTYLIGNGAATSTQRPAIAIQDNGAALFVVINGVYVAANTTCWAGTSRTDLFDDTNASADGVTALKATPANKWLYLYSKPNIVCKTS